MAISIPPASLKAFGKLRRPAPSAALIKRKIVPTMLVPERITLVNQDSLLNYHEVKYLE